MSDPITISNQPEENPAADFNLLRKEGIEHIQKLAGKIWTDYNTHDPGITILDHLCYAITDLSYRMDYDIKDLLAEEDGEPYKSIFSPAGILTTNPVTINDIRKIVMDVEGVKNAWIEKVQQPEPEIFLNEKDKTLNLSLEDGNESIKIKGLYRVLVEKDETTAQSAEIHPNIKARLSNCRSLCEDFSEIKILDVQLITVSGEIEVGQAEDINRFIADVLLRIADYISPRIRFYTLSELLEKGWQIDEIFDGPALAHGFIDNNELSKLSRKKELHTSDIIREMMDAPEVLAINNAALSTGSAAPEKWRLSLDSEKTPKLDITGTLDNLILYKNGIVTGVDKEVVKSLFYEARNSTQYPLLNEEDRDITLPACQNRHIKNYYSIQNQFQEVYGIGETGLPDSAPPRRKAQARQLKAYLMLFEQIMANYLAQTAHVKDLFSFRQKELRTYFSQSLLNDVPDAHSIIKNPETHPAKLAESNESKATAIERKNRFLNHLLARFGENLSNYSVVLQGLEGGDDNPRLRLIEDKLNFLEDYPSVSNDRNKAFNYTLPGWNTANISGLEKRIYRKLGIRNILKQDLSGKNEEGFHLTEHILLRPRQEDLFLLSQYLTPKDIDDFVQSDRDGWVKCICPGHGLQSGESIQIRGTKVYNEVYIVDRVLENSFEIKTAFQGGRKETAEEDEFGEKTPNWIRTEIDTRLLILTQPIQEFKQSEIEGFVSCLVGKHELEENEMIEITGTSAYNGIYTIKNVKKDTFDIEQAFNGSETTGRWMRKNQTKDPYSLQLTFVFPDWTGRFKNPRFRQFIENTVREETPVHLTPYIQWLNKEEMQRFENAFKYWLEQLRINS